ncbi:MAG: hypothetical protein ACU85E_05895 [Gammaproteobacteria bacterium]
MSATEARFLFIFKARKLVFNKLSFFLRRAEKKTRDKSVAAFITFKPLHLSGLLFLLFFCGFSSAVTDPLPVGKQTARLQDDIQGPVKIKLQTPRNYGYSLGDQITLIAQISTPLFYSLETGFLPKPGPVTDWLQLISIAPIDASSDQDYALAITYQVFKSVPVPTDLTLPPLPLRFKHQGKSLIQMLPPWSFSYNPLIPKNKNENQIEPEPEIPPMPLTTHDSVKKLAYLVAAISGLLFYIIWFYGKAPFLERYSGAFGKACRTLKHLKKQPPSEVNRLKALQCFHHALNELAGETVFIEQLPAFYRRLPKYAPLQQKTEEFFKISQRLFFTENAEGSASISLDQIEALCLHYRKLERSSRWL